MAEMVNLLAKGVVRKAEAGGYLHRVVLVAGHADRPGQSGQSYRSCTDFRANNARTEVNPFPAPDLADCIRRV